MHINNLNHDKIEYKGTKIERQVTMKELINQFYSLVRQNMPTAGGFDDIKMSLNKDDEGESFLSVETFEDYEANKFINNLKISYEPNDKDFKISMRIMKGSKQEILDYLGNENNLSEIKSLMNELKQRSDEK